MKQLNNERENERRHRKGLFASFFFFTNILKMNDLHSASVYPSNITLVQLSEDAFH